MLEVEGQPCTQNIIQNGCCHTLLNGEQVSQDYQSKLNHIVHSTVNPHLSGPSLDQICETVGYVKQYIFNRENR